MERFQPDVVFSKVELSKEIAAMFEHVTVVLRRNIRL